MHQSIYPTESVIDGKLFKRVGNPQLSIDPDSVVVGYNPIPTETKYLIWVLNRWLYRWEWVPLEAFQAGQDTANITRNKLAAYNALKEDLIGLGAI